MTVTNRRKSNTFYVILIAGAAALGGFLFGFDTAVINGAVAALANAFNANSVQTGLAVSLALLGSAVGAPSTRGQSQTVMVESKQWWSLPCCLPSVL